MTSRPPMSRKKRARLWVYGSAFVLYLVLFWGMGAASFFILHPSRNAINVPEGRREFIEVGGKKVELWVARTRAAAMEGTPRGWVLDFSPNAGRAEWGLMYGIGEWEGMPIEYIAPNYPGYGGSEGAATLRGVHESALAAYDEARRGFRTRRSS
jgi:hypothetical protein